MNDTFNALVLNQTDDKKITADFEQLSINDLPDGDVLVNISHSSLNYKDGLAVTGKGKIARFFPMVPGIDFVGTVEASDSDRFSVGDSVVLTGWGVGEKHWGGYAGYARVKSDWLVPLPDALSHEQAMAIGTAGFTAMMAVMALQAHNVTPESGDIVVTGASGGVGSVAIAILAHLGYTVFASTGRESEADYLKSLGANEVIGRFEAPERPMGSSRWAGAVDGVGGDTLANILSAMNYGGSVACYGLAGGVDLNTSVFPFILRGVNLLGIDSVMCPADYRAKVWDRLAADLPLDKLAEITTVEPLSNIKSLADDIVAGKIRGRVVVDVSR